MYNILFRKRWSYENVQNYGNPVVCCFSRCIGCMLQRYTCYHTIRRIACRAGSNDRSETGWTAGTVIRKYIIRQTRYSILFIGLLCYIIQFSISLYSITKKAWITVHACYTYYSFFYSTLSYPLVNPILSICLSQMIYVLAFCTFSCLPLIVVFCIAFITSGPLPFRIST